MRLELDRFVVRSWCEVDAESLALYANNRKIWRNLRDAFPHPYDLADARKFIARATGQDPATVFCIEIDGAAVGGVGFRLHEDVERYNAEIGYWLAEEFWGQGVMTRILRAVTEYAMRTHGLRRVYAMPFAWNGASCRVLEKSGYAREGRMRCSAFKDGQSVDQILYANTGEGCPEEG